MASSGMVTLYGATQLCKEGRAHWTQCVLAGGMPLMQSYMQGVEPPYSVKVAGDWADLELSPSSHTRAPLILELKEWANMAERGAVGQSEERQLEE
ncbi:hypothetical protein ACLOJK_033251 [Asimina triloba]